MKRLINVALVVMCAVLMGVLLEACSGGGEVSSASNTSSSQTGVANGAAGSVDIKASVNEYSWEELSTISAEISAAGDEAGGTEIAKKYNLCNPDGSLDGAQLKDIELSSGLQAQVQIIGFNHDDKSTDGNKAGISFIFKDCIAEHEMNPLSNDEAAYNAAIESWEQSLSDVLAFYPDGVPANAGGWEASSMRAWLNGDLLSRIPEDLSAAIIAVDKKTNNTGWTKGEVDGVVTTTSDKLWLPSYVELGGVYKVVGDRSAYSQYVADIMNAEGQEYKLFCDMNVDNSGSNSILEKKYNGSECYWWGRSPSSDDSGGFNYVNAGGYLGRGARADDSGGIAPGFCI